MKLIYAVMVSMVYIIVKGWQGNFLRDLTKLLFSLNMSVFDLEFIPNCVMLTQSKDMLELWKVRASTRIYKIVID